MRERGYPEWAPEGCTDPDNFGASLPYQHETRLLLIEIGLPVDRDSWLRRCGLPPASEGWRNLEKVAGRQMMPIFAAIPGVTGTIILLYGLLPPATGIVTCTTLGEMANQGTTHRIRLCFTGTFETPPRKFNRYLRFYYFYSVERIGKYSLYAITIWI